MSHFPYVGSGPYCYANAFAMMFGEAAPSPAVIEIATCSPFGMQLVGGTLPFFDPYGWTPETGFETALEAMGWTSTVEAGGDEEEAVDRLRAALAGGPVWVGPVEMGHLRFQPAMTAPVGADHYVVVLAIEDGWVRMHDPEGHPHATLPLDDFLAAWRAETLDYGAPFTMRTGFRRLRAVGEDEAVRGVLDQAAGWLSMERGVGVSPGTIGNGEAAEALAERIGSGCPAELRAHLVRFAVRVGARRLTDAASGLARIGLTDAANIALEQARRVGSLQYLLTTGRDAEAAAVLRALAPSYGRWLTALRAGR
ncbi:hypothetical protein [Caulobacter mirabilis]|uniref:Uncharacterized protein n=1 Tax=Caulobacter mirabilis TaxID=69666 RepID=A0A2D2B199_9CAUL|nr:hypothetical protein [Caulobacter mirabilis]ATQ43987.1 hypothetical protein CSW64_17135 [Caulobacter mirabilis]